MPSKTSTNRGNSSSANKGNSSSVTKRSSSSGKTHTHSAVSKPVPGKGGKSK